MSKFFNHYDCARIAERLLAAAPIGQSGAMKMGNAGKAVARLFIRRQYMLGALAEVRPADDSPSASRTRRHVAEPMPRAALKTLCQVEIDRYFMALAPPRAAFDDSRLYRPKLSQSPRLAAASLIPDLLYLMRWLRRLESRESRHDGRNARL